ncbi:hypothetical protein V1509DRAFT_613427 [Lipomyces kononenkoae]
MPIGWLGTPDANKLNDHSDIQETVIVYDFEEDAEDVDLTVLFQYLVPAFRSSTDTKAQWFLSANELLNDKALLLGSSLLIIGSALALTILPYTVRAAKNACRRKTDIGLYAMNYSNSYVASVTVYSSYTQALQAFIGADKFRN